MAAAPPAVSAGGLDSFFHFTTWGTTMPRELLAGLASSIVMSCLIFVAPNRRRTGQGAGHRLDAVDRHGGLPAVPPHPPAPVVGLGLSSRRGRLRRPPRNEGAGRRRRPAPSAILAAAMAVLLLILALGIILLSAELFTNGVEWFGRRYELGEGAVGSVLAAVGTALPETLVPIIAIVFTGGKAADDIGVGAILGAPFMLSSLAMVVTAAAVVIFTWRGRRLSLIHI